VGGGGDLVKGYPQGWPGAEESPTQADARRRHERQGHEQGWPDNRKSSCQLCAERAKREAIEARIRAGKLVQE
jgi:hypothetical protein